MKKVHCFRLRACFGPADVLTMLRQIAEDPRHAAHGPDFSFDWMKRRAGLSASSPIGVEALAADLRKAVASSKAGEGALLIGKRTELPGGRHEVPIGIAVMDAAIFAELIVQGLSESGVRGLQVESVEGDSEIRVPLSLRTQGSIYDEYIRNFPVPPYIRVEDRGIGEAPKPLKTKGKK